MKRALFICAAALGICTQLFAQASGLGPLSMSPDITSGTFPCGVRYWFVANPRDKGLADFAVVQTGLSADSALSARGEISSGANTRPADFFHSHGAQYGPEGFIKYYGQDSRVFHFRDVRVDNPAVMDSALLVLRDILSRQCGPRAVIVSGDINPAVVRDRLSLLCLTIPEFSLEADFPEPKEVYIPESDSLGVSFVFTSTDRAYRNTALPYIGRYMSAQVKCLFLQRLDRVLRERGIPYSCSGSSDFVHINVADSLNAELSECINTVKKSICTYGFTPDELSFAQVACTEQVCEAALPGCGLHNWQYVSKCTSTFLYNTDLATASTVRGLLERPRLHPSRDLDRLNKFARALLDCGPDSSAVMAPVFYPEAENLLALEIPKKKVRMLSSASEAVTGGKIYIFSNGMKVIYKYMPELDGKFHYCLALRGGYNLIDSLQASEQPYIADVFSSSRICMVSGRDFFSALRMRGISMSASADWSNFSLEGSAPVKELSHVLSALICCAYKREYDEQAFHYNLQCETVGGEMPEISEDFLPRVSSYLDSRFANLNDGVLIIVGDLDEQEFVSTLEGRLSLARTGRQFSKKQMRTLGLSSGRTVSTMDGAVDQMRISMSCEHNITAESYLSFRTACAVMEQELSTMLFDSGFYVDVAGTVSVNPVESYSMNVMCQSCPADGLPQGQSPLSAADLAIQIRGAVSNMSASNLDDVHFEECKSRAVSSLEKLLSNPRVLIRFAKYRYCDNRDICSDYKKRIKAVNREKVDGIFSSLNAGEIRELIIQ